MPVLEVHGLNLVRSRQSRYTGGVGNRLKALGLQLHEFRRARWSSIKEPARCMDACPSFFSRAERESVPVPEGLVRRGTVELSINANPLLIQVDHFSEDVRSLSVEHPQRIPSILRVAFQHYGEPVEPRQ